MFETEKTGHNQRNFFFISHTVDSAVYFSVFLIAMWNISMK